MQLDSKRQAELNRRRGSTGRTIIQVLWFLITGTAAYFFINWLFVSETISYDQIYRWGIPRTVPELGLFVGAIFLVFFALQIVFLLGYLIASPEGRHRTGQPTAYSHNTEFADPFDNEWES